ncbi:MAG TPA: tetratricopeptide repeat protein [Paucimonas sp.]|nr:tetratricopeptide repeat protein [Paucimonas sp.]
MSLINRMLQELDARGSDGARGGPVYASVRAVPEARKNYLAWGAAVVAAMLVGGTASWLWLRATTMPLQVPSAELPLKLAPELRTRPVQPAPPLQEPLAAPAAPQPVAGTGAAPPAAVDADSGGASAPPPTAAADSGNALAAPAQAETRQAQRVQQSVPPAAEPTPKPAPASAAAPKAAKPEPAKSAEAPSAAAVPAKQVKELTPQQRSENEYRRASTLVAQGRGAEAVAALEQALQFDPQHAAARQTLVGLLLESRRQDEAMRKLQEGLALDARQTGMTMILARLQVEKNEIRAAVETLQRGLPHAGDRGDYRAFLAALQQRLGQHKDAIEHYLAALKTAPQNAVWWMGIGISLQAENRLAEARDAFGRAKAANTLTPELQAFVDQKLAQLPR